MKLKHNENYFKKSDNLRIIGLGTAIVGFLMLWIRLHWLTYMLAPVGLIAGLVMFFVGSAGRSSETDIDEYIKRETVDIEVDFAGDRHYEKRLLKHIPPIVAEGYEYSDGLMFKKAKNSSVRSSEYTKAMIYVLSDRLYISERHVDIVGGKTYKNIVEIKYDDVASIDIAREEKRVSFDEKTFAVKICDFTVTHNGGAWRAPINDDVDLEKLINRINEVMTEHRKARA